MFLRPRHSRSARHLRDHAPKTPEKVEQARISRQSTQQDIDFGQMPGLSDRVFPPYRRGIEFLSWSPTAVATERFPRPDGWGIGISPAPPWYAGNTGVLRRTGWTVC